ncbi:MAG: DedA family protein [Candidatus Omnitrophota bacterium]|nr:DedA family protein [Candidatus Omnitrophota bacterium]
MEYIVNIVETIFHFDRYLGIIVQNYGNWVYLFLFLIIFAETGLVITPFLPGDSLIFAVGTLAAMEIFNPWWLFAVLVSAAVIGDTVNYAVGKFLGHEILKYGHGRFLKPEHIDKTHRFFEKYGGKTIILARFIPIVRTFAPFVAGIGSMSYLKFIIYNVVGGFLWVAIFLACGYFFGNAPVIKNNFTLAILGIMVVSAMPVFIEFWRARKEKSRKKTLSN